MAFDITVFQSSLLSLAAIKRYLEDALRPIKSIRRVDAVDSLAALILINVHSFNQEWKRFESFAKDNPDVRKTLKTAAPLVRRIRSWRGIGRLRSGALAHEPFSKEDQSLVDIAALFGPGKAPTELWEQIILGECAVYAIAIALTRHDLDRKSAVSKVYKDGPHILQRAGIESEAEFERDIGILRHSILQEDPSLIVMFQPDE